MTTQQTPVDQMTVADGPEHKAARIREKMTEAKMLARFPDRALAVRIIDDSITYLIEQDKMARSKDPHLLRDCTEPSIWRALTHAVLAGLAMDGKRAYGIPYNDQLVYTPHYTGLYIIAKRNPIVRDVRTYLRHADDDWEMVREGDSEHFRHGPTFSGELVGVYCEVTYTDRPTLREYMPKSEIEKVRNASKMGGDEGGSRGPWKEWYSELARKAVARRTLKHAALDDPAMDAALKSLDDRDALEQAIAETQSRTTATHAKLANLPAPAAPVIAPDGEVRLPADVIQKLDACQSMEDINDAYADLHRDYAHRTCWPQVEEYINIRVADIKEAEQGESVPAGQLFGTGGQIGT